MLGGAGGGVFVAIEVEAVEGLGVEGLGQDRQDNILDMPGHDMTRQYMT